MFNTRLLSQTPLLAMVCLAVSFGPTASAANPVAAVPTVTRIKVQPIEHATGQLGSDIAAPDSALVVNSRAGSGEIAYSYLVTVMIAGPPNLDLGGKVNKGAQRQLRIVAVENGRIRKILLSALRNLRAIPPSGEFGVPILLEPGGCAPVTIRATVLGAKAPSSFKTTIDFVCQN